MASAEIALVCGLKVRVGCQDRLCVNSHADETLAQACTTYGLRAACSPRSLLLRPSKWRKQFARLLQVPEQRKL